MRYHYSHHGDKLFDDAVAIEPIVMLHLFWGHFIFTLWYQAGTKHFAEEISQFNLKVGIEMWKCSQCSCFVSTHYYIISSFPAHMQPTKHRRPPFCQSGSRMNWLVRVWGVDGAPIILWITLSSPRQLWKCYPPFCGDKPNCVEQDGWGAHWNPLAWGLFNPLYPECWQWHNFTHTPAQSAS